jgi:hypothetical protein
MRGVAFLCDYHGFRPRRGNVATFLGFRSSHRSGTADTLTVGHEARQGDTAMNETIETDRIIALRGQLLRFEVEALGGTAEEMSIAGASASEAERHRIVSVTTTGDEQRAAIAEWRRCIREVTAILARLEANGGRA